ncbi:MAG: amidohydrolase family protein [Bryobacteraceae bacterium]|nr:amidohydrolase family protein [Bryobacteraceae bacterium]
MIDAHHHLWQYSAAAYPWIGHDMAVLKQDFLPARLGREMTAAGVEGAVTVQARQTLEETQWLLEMAGANDFLMGVVGWVPLADPDCAVHLERFAPHPKLKGVRHVVQDEPDDDFILGAGFQRGVGLLRQFSLVYDILIYERHLPQSIRFVDAHPHQVFVLDHIAKPRIGDGAISPWRENLRELARRPHVYCKISGMATEARRGWTPDDLRPYFDAALEAFGPHRLMFGSDWPVLLLAGEYAPWAATVREWIRPLSQSEQRRILRETAISAYRL